MSLNKCEKIENNHMELEISVDRETFQEAINKAYRKNVKQFNIPGFRKGKAPKKYIENLYGEGVFYEDAVDATYGRAYEEAINEAKITPVGHPEMNISTIGEDGYTFTVKVYTKPEITVKSYKGLEAPFAEASVSDEDVKQELERRREHNAQLTPVDREAKLGDTAVIDYEGFCEGKAFEGGKGENHDLKLGSGSFIPGFEDQLVGKKAGDAVDVNVTFPTPYHSEELAGKPATFKVVVKEVKEAVLPELDDEFAKDISEFETLEALSESIRTRLLEYRTRAADEGFEGALMSQVLDSIEGDIPACMYEDESERMIEDYAYRMQSQGMRLEDYLSMSGISMDDFKKQMLPQAEQRVKTTLAMEAIARQEKIEVSEEECSEEVKKLSEQYKMEEEEVRKLLDLKMLKSDIANRKAMDLIKSSAVKTAPEKKPKETKAKKSGASKSKKAKTEEASVEVAPEGTEEK